MDSIKKFLGQVEPLELQQKIRDFRTLNIKDMSYREIQQAISNVITFEQPSGARQVILPYQTCTYLCGTRFYRIRKIPSDDKKIPLRSMSSIDDCWEPPTNVVGIGRLNKKNEPLLYTTVADPGIPLEELKISDNENFSLIVYEAIDDVKVNVIGASIETDGLDKSELLILSLLQDFLHHEFTRDVGIGTEYLYKTSESIAKDYFDLPAETQDAWCYPSVAKKEGYNVCFRESKRNKLKLLGVQISTARKINKGYQLTVKLVGKEDVSTGCVNFYQIGSDVQKEIFPELGISNINDTN